MRYGEDAQRDVADDGVNVRPESIDVLGDTALQGNVVGESTAKVTAGPMLSKRPKCKTFVRQLLGRGQPFEGSVNYPVDATSHAVEFVAIGNGCQFKEPVNKLSVSRAAKPLDLRGYERYSSFRVVASVTGCQASRDTSALYRELAMPPSGSGR
jgi:hypothetical protein